MNEAKFNDKLRSDWDVQLAKKSRSIDYKLIFENGYGKMDKTQFISSIFEHFDIDSGLFNANVCGCVSNISDVMLKDPQMLTLFIFYCLEKF